MPEKEIPDNPEAGGKQDEDPNRESGRHDVSNDPKIGPVLREKREEMGLGLSDVYEITKIRPNFLEALEEEDWAKLPSPTLVMGFIRAYADALGLDDKVLVELYRKIAASGDGGLQPLVESRRYRGRLLVLAVLAVCILLAGGGAAYFWKTSESKKDDKFVAAPLDKEETSVDQEKTAEPRRKARSEPTEPSAKAMPSPEEEISLSGGHDEPQDFTPGGDAMGDEPGISGGSLAKPESPALRDGEVSEEVFKPLSTETVGRQSASPGEEVRTQTLGMLVKSRTWVRVVVDGQEPKEYIFEPGNRRQWEAGEGFDLVIGNAGGVELNYNGEKLSGLGDANQVVRLNLPRDLERIGRGR